MRISKSHAARLAAIVDAGKFTDVETATDVLLADALARFEQSGTVTIQVGRTMNPEVQQRINQAVRAADAIEDAADLSPGTFLEAVLTDLLPCGQFRELDDVVDAIESLYNLDAAEVAEATPRLEAALSRLNEEEPPEDAPLLLNARAAMMLRKSAAIAGKDPQEHLNELLEVAGNTP